jgi:hypothetical protein
MRYCTGKMQEDRDKHRNAQGHKLEKTLKYYTDNSNKYSGDSMSPIGSSDDQMLINKLIESKNFVIIPVNLSNDQTMYTHFYTIGLWYFWNIPDIVMKFENPMKNINPEMINLIYDILVNRMLECEKEIIDQKQERNTLGLDKINLQCELTIIREDEYFDIQSILLLWFNMFYVKIEVDTENQPIMPPVYQIQFNQKTYDQYEQNIIQRLMQNVKSSDESLDDSSSSHSDIESLDSD